MNSLTIAFAFAGNSPSIISPVAIENGASKSYVIACMCGWIMILVSQIHYNYDSIKITYCWHIISSSTIFSIGDLSHKSNRARNRLTIKRKNEVNYSVIELPEHRGTKPRVHP